jgi:hypothetical protein
MQARFDQQQATIEALSKSLATAQNEYEHIRRTQSHDMGMLEACRLRESARPSVLEAEEIGRSRDLDTSALEDCRRREGYYRNEQVAQRERARTWNEQASHELYLRNEQKLAESEHTASAWIRSQSNISW